MNEEIEEIDDKEGVMERARLKGSRVAKLTERLAQKWGETGNWSWRKDVRSTVGAIGSYVRELDEITMQEPYEAAEALLGLVRELPNLREKIDEVIRA